MEIDTTRNFGSEDTVDLVEVGIMEESVLEVSVSLLRLHGVYEEVEK